MVTRSFLALHEASVSGQSILSRAGCAAWLTVVGGRAMARPQQFALVLLCGTVTIAGWGAARLGGFARDTTKMVAHVLRDAFMSGQRAPKPALHRSIRRAN